MRELLRCCCISSIIENMPSPFLLLLVFLFTLACVWNRYFSASRFPNLPPGPAPGLFGNKIPSPFAWRTYQKWTEKYGAIFTIWLGNTPMFVVGSYHAATDLLERRGAVVTADRPRSIAAGETLSGDKRILLVRYGERWRRLRKALHSHLQPRSAATYEPKQEVAARTLVLDLAKQDKDFFKHARRYAATVVVQVTYGTRKSISYDDPEITLVQSCQDKLADYLRPGRYKIDSYPFLKYWPGYLSDAREGHETELALFRTQLDEVRKNMDTNSVDECFVSFLLRSLKEYNLSLDEASYLAGSLFGAGSETTASAINIALMAAALYPEPQRWLQEDLDRLLRRERPPAFSDFPDLPRLTAWVNEVLRWRSVSSGGFVHALREDLSYNQYVLPKGSWIVGNHWSIHADPEVFPDPENFDPSRWLIKESGGSEKVRSDIRNYAFGFGRRVCPGQHIATRSLHITISSILWAFNISKALDPRTGKEIDIDSLAFTDRANSHPLPFSVRFEERFDGAIDTFQQLENQ